MQDMFTTKLKKFKQKNQKLVTSAIEAHLRRDKEEYKKYLQAKSLSPPRNRETPIFETMQSLSTTLPKIPTNKGVCVGTQAVLETAEQTHQHN